MALYGFKRLFYWVFPVTSFVVLPVIQGTTPAFMLCFVLLFAFPLLAPQKQCFLFYKIIFIFLLALALMLGLAQAGVFFLDVPSLHGLALVDNANPDKVFLRGTIFTQHLYLLAAIIAFSFVATSFEDVDIKYVFWGIRLLIAYGFFEWLAYLLTGNQVDFLTNRVFDDQNAEVEGSFFQVMAIGGLQLQRMKSLTGEPSMFAFTILPFWVLAIEFKRKTDILLTTAALILSLSTSAALGMFVYAFYCLFNARPKAKLVLLGSLFAVLFLLFALWGDVIETVWTQLVVEKFTAESVSGQDRLGGISAAIHFWSDANWWTKIFGIGFGISRSTDFFSTMLVNGGIIGILFWITLFFLPFVLVRGESRRKMMKLLPAVLVLFATMFSSVPEYMYLNIWVTLGITYHLLLTSIAAVHTEPLLPFNEGQIKALN